MTHTSTLTSYKAPYFENEHVISSITYVTPLIMLFQYTIQSIYNYTLKHILYNIAMSQTYQPICFFVILFATENLQ